MKRRSAKTARHIALALALVIPIFLLLGYFFIGYVSIDTTLRTEAEANALFASQIIQSNPDYWRFEQIRLQEFLSRRLIKTPNEIRRIVDLNNATVAEHRDQVAYPFIMRSHHLYDSGKVVAKLEIIRSLRPLLRETLLVGFFGYLLTFALYLWVKIFVINPRQQAEEALRQSEQREQARATELQAVLDAVPAYIFLAHDPECRYMTGNPMSYELLGLPLGSNVSLSAAKNERPANLQVMKDGREIPVQVLPVQRAAAGQIVRDYEFDLVQAGGASRHLLGNAVPLLDETGQPRGAVAAFIDVTARKQAEEALHNSNERTINILESINAGFFALNNDLVVTYYNQAAARLLDKSSQEVLGRNMFEAFPEVKGSIFEENYRLAIKNKRAISFETYFDVEPYKNWYEVRVYPYRDGISVYFHVTTERKQAEEALKTSEERFKAVFEGAAIGIGLLDLEGVILKVNPAAQELLGYEAQEQVGKHLSEILHPEDNSSTLALYQEVRGGKLDHYRLANRFLTKDGRLLWLDFTVSLIRGVKGEPLFAIAMGQDITEHKEAEERISHYHSRLQGLAAQLAGVQEAERQGLTRELHDRVGQNLSVLGINLNLLQSLTSEGDADQIQARLADAVGLVEQTATLIRNLMAELRPPELDDYGLLEALRSHGAKFSQRTNIAVDVVGEEPALRLDPSVEISLFRIVQEALTNVAKHAQATRVRVIKEVDAGKVRLTIADNGAGFDLTRLETTKGRQGWGMITMTERAVAAGGHCRIDSRAGKGTRVIVEVPR